MQSAMQLYPAPGYEAGPQKPWIFRTDAEGNLLWERVMGADVASTQYYADAVQVGDKEFVFLCQDALYPPPYPYGDINCPNVVVGSQDNYWVFHLTDIFDYDSIEEQVGWSGDGVGVYPNPSKDLVWIYGVEATEVRVYNVLGQLVKTAQATNEINVSGLPEGVYLLRITNANGISQTKRITVVK